VVPDVVVGVLVSVTAKSISRKNKNYFSYTIPTYYNRLLLSLLVRMDLNIDMQILYQNHLFQDKRGILEKEYTDYWQNSFDYKCLEIQKRDFVFTNYYFFSYGMVD
jgi:hypothetical protein